MNRVSGLAVLVFSALPAVALAAIVQKSGTEVWTPTSGSAGTAHGDLLTTADYYGLQTLTLWQYGHAPCMLGGGESVLSTHAVGSLAPIKACEPTGGEQWKHADLGSGKYVTAIATCTKPGGDASIHGFQVWGATIDDTGKLTADRTPVKLEFLDCKKWQPKQACAPGSVATGIRAYWSDSTSGIQGLALRCHELEERNQK